MKDRLEFSCVDGCRDPVMVVLYLFVDRVRVVHPIIPFRSADEMKNGFRIGVNDCAVS